MKPPFPGTVVRVSMKLAAFKALRGCLPARTLLRVLRTMGRVKLPGEWSNAKPARDPKDAGTRAQLGDAVALYRALLDHLPRDHAARVAATVIEAAAIAFLRGSLPVLDEQAIVAMNPSDRERLVSSLLDTFPNTDWVLDGPSDTAIHCKIVRCRFPELLHELGHPELAPAFCAGDIAYFQRYQPGISLERPCTIAAGGDRCDFIFSVRDQPGGEPRAHQV